MSLFPDPLAILVAALRTQLGSRRWIADRLPVPVESDLPAVWINPLPGSSTLAPWGDSAPLLDWPAFDVDVLAPASKGPKALNDYAAEVRQALLAIPRVDPRVKRVVEEVPLGRRPDWNPSILRVGGEYSLAVARL